MAGPRGGSHHRGEAGPLSVAPAAASVGGCGGTRAGAGAGAAGRAGPPAGTRIGARPRRCAHARGAQPPPALAAIPLGGRPPPPVAPSRTPTRRVFGTHALCLSLGISCHCCAWRARPAHRPVVDGGQPRPARGAAPMPAPLGRGAPVGTGGRRRPRPGHCHPTLADRPPSPALGRAPPPARAARPITTRRPTGSRHASRTDGARRVAPARRGRRGARRRGHRLRDG